MRSINIACGLLACALVIGCGDKDAGAAHNDSATATTGAPTADGGSTTTQDPAGSQAFQGSASGGVDAPSMAGDAQFWTTRAKGMQFWVLNMYPKGAGEGRISFTLMKKSRPTPGEYAIGDKTLDGEMFGAVYVPADPSTSVTATSGKVTITTSAADKVTGSFEFDGLVADMKNLSAPGKPVTMKGTFTATCVGAQATGNVCE